MIFGVAPQMSDPFRQTLPMKMQTKDMEVAYDEVVAVFGEARLVKIEGRLHLLGGSMADRTEAVEWVMMFLPDEVVRMQR